MALLAAALQDRRDILREGDRRLSSARRQACGLPRRSPSRPAGMRIRRSNGESRSWHSSQSLLDLRTCSMMPEKWAPAVIRHTECQNCPPADDYLGMDHRRAMRPDGTPASSTTRDPVNQDAVYARAAEEFGPPLARLAAAYEADPARQQDLLQDLHFALWRSVAAFRNQCSLRTWVYRVAHNTATTYVRQQRKTRRVPLAGLEELDHLADDTDVERSTNDAVVSERSRSSFNDSSRLIEMFSSSIWKVCRQPRSATWSAYRRRTSLRRSIESGIT